MTHATKSGCGALSSPATESCIEPVRYLLSFLPSNDLQTRRLRSRPMPMIGTRHVMDLIPDHPNRPYDMKKAIAEIVDDGDFFEVCPLWAANIVGGFARIAGHVIGIVGNQPQILPGVSTSTSRRRRLASCARAAFNVSLVTFVDVPGFFPGTRPGVRRHHSPRRGAAATATARQRFPGCRSSPARVTAVRTSL